MLAARLAGALGVTSGDLVAMERNQAEENARLVAALVARGMDCETARQIQQTLAPSDGRGNFGSTRGYSSPAEIVEWAVSPSITKMSEEPTSDTHRDDIVARREGGSFPA
jgi:hypothetical protein